MTTLLTDILTNARERVAGLSPLQPVILKHPLPERAWRLLGLVRIDGGVYTSARLRRALFLKTTIAGSRGVRSVFLSPRTELGLPVFSSETILAGRRRMFLVDVQRRGSGDDHDDGELYARLCGIRDRYADILQDPLTLRGEIMKTFSPAFVYVKLPPGADERALQLFHEYLDVFLELVRRAEPLQGEALAAEQRREEAFMQTVLAHDPAVKVYSVFFGRRGGVARAMDMFFGR